MRRIAIIKIVDSVSALKIFVHTPAGHVIDPRNGCTSPRLSMLHFLASSSTVGGALMTTGYKEDLVADIPRGTSLDVIGKPQSRQDPMEAIFAIRKGEHTLFQ
jgi:hypothetical protein